MTGVYILGIAMTPCGKFPTESVKSLSAQAVIAALRDAGIDRDMVEAAWFANTRQGLLEGQNTIRGQCALRPLGFQGIPIVNVENACASGSTAVWSAAAGLEAGLADVALVVGVERMFFPEQRDAMFRAFAGGTDIHRLDEFRARIAGAGIELVPEFVRGVDTGQRSFFMDSYAAQARVHMQTYGTTLRQFAACAAKNHWHSTMNPLSQYRINLSTEAVLADKLVSWPFTRAMCAPISDGAAAVVLVHERVINRYGRRRAIRLRAIELVSGTERPMAAFDRHIGALAARRAYDRAGLGPDSIDVAEVHDACAYAEIQQIENLGLVTPGDGGPASERGDTRLGGRVPVNPSGGLVSKGHPVGATGIMQLYELATQLRGEAGARQVSGARIAIAENGGGFYEVEEAATVVTVLEATA